MNIDMSERDANMYSPLTLAFLGDSVYEQLVREKLVTEANMPTGKLHELKVKKVCAEFQSDALEKIVGMLTEHEISIVKRGRNATGNTVPKHVNAVVYRRATALEALFGYLDLIGNQQRIDELFEYIWANSKEDL